MGAALQHGVWASHHSVSPPALRVSRTPGSAWRLTLPSASSSQRPYVPCAPIWNSSSSEQPSRHRTVVPTAMPSLLPQILPILQWMGDGGCVRGLQTQPPALLGGNKGRELRIEGSVRASQDWKPPTFPIWEQRQCYTSLLQAVNTPGVT